MRYMSAVHRRGYSAAGRGICKPAARLDSWFAMLAVFSYSRASLPGIEPPATVFRRLLLKNYQRGRYSVLRFAEREHDAWRRAA